MTKRDSTDSNLSMTKSARKSIIKSHRQSITSTLAGLSPQRFDSISSPGTVSPIGFAKLAREAIKKSRKNIRKTTNPSVAKAEPEGASRKLKSTNTRSILMGMDGTAICHINEDANRFAVREKTKIVAIPVAEYERGNTPIELHDAITRMETRGRTQLELANLKNNKWYTPNVCACTEISERTSMGDTSHVDGRVTPEDDFNPRVHYSVKPDRIHGTATSGGLKIPLDCIQSGMKISRFKRHGGSILDEDLRDGGS
jgi:hypothetical protein